MEVNLIRIIDAVWGLNTRVPKQAGLVFYSTPFRARRGVRQGDILSPIIFNIVEDDTTSKSEEWAYSSFYADDCKLWSDDPADVQNYAELFTQGFESEFGEKEGYDHG